MYKYRHPTWTKHVSNSNTLLILHTMTSLNSLIGTYRVHSVSCPGERPSPPRKVASCHPNGNPHQMNNCLCYHSCDRPWDDFSSLFDPDLWVCSCSCCPFLMPFVSASILCWNSPPPLSNCQVIVRYYSIYKLIDYFKLLLLIKKKIPFYSN